MIPPIIEAMIIPAAKASLFTDRDYGMLIK